MTKRILVGVLMGMFLIGAFSGEVFANKTGNQEKSIVVCTTSVLGDFAREVGGDRIEVETIVSTGMCPAHFDIKPSDVYAVSKASLIFFHGIEPWLENLVQASGNEGVQKIRIKGAWNFPAAALKKVELITKALSEYEPENAAYFEENADGIIKSINETAKRLKEEAERLKVGQIKVICMKWQEDFVKWLGFNVVATYLPPERLSLKQTLELVKKGKEENIAVVVDNLQSGTKFGAKLASEVGATQVILSNFPGAIPGTKSYVKLIEYNAGQLFDAIKEKQYENEEN